MVRLEPSSAWVSVVSVCKTRPWVSVSVRLPPTMSAAVLMLTSLGSADYNSVFPAGITVAATFDRGLMYRRGYAMGAEFRDKGVGAFLRPPDLYLKASLTRQRQVDIQLGPVAGALGRAPAAGRNWEGFSPDPSA